MKNSTTLLFYLSNSNFKWDKSTFLHSNTFSNIARYTTITPFSEQWCKEKKAELFKKRFPAIFPDMSLIKDTNYLAITKYELRCLNLHALKKLPGIYMITNKVTKKFYIGMSIDLKDRIEDYLNIKWLERNRTSRIHKALLKYGFENFSITILELDMNKKTSIGVHWTKKEDFTANYWRKREDFYIKLFKPQYNIKRSQYNRDIITTFNERKKISKDIPMKVMNLLDKCLNEKLLGYNLLNFNYYFKSNRYMFVASTPKGAIKAYSTGWHLGDVKDDTGWSFTEINPPFSIQFVLQYQNLINKKDLANFYTKEKSGFVREKLRLKLKALKAQLNQPDVAKKATLNKDKNMKNLRSDTTKVTRGIIGTTGVRSFSTTSKRVEDTKFPNQIEKKGSKVNNNNQKTFTLNLEDRDWKNTTIGLGKDTKILKKRPTKIIILKLNKDYLELITVNVKNQKTDLFKTLLIGLVRFMFKKLPKRSFTNINYQNLLSWLYLAFISLILVISYIFYLHNLLENLLESKDELEKEVEEDHFVQPLPPEVEKDHASKWDNDVNKTGLNLDEGNNKQAQGLISFNQDVIYYPQDNNKDLKGQSNKNIFERWFGGRLNKVDPQKINIPHPESIIIKEVYGREEQAQREFEKISKLIVEEVKANSKISFDEFIYTVKLCLWEKDYDMRERIIEKFSQNNGLVDTILFKEKSNPSSVYDIASPDKRMNTPLTGIRPHLDTDNVITSPSPINFSPFTPITYEELNKEIQINLGKISQLETIQEEDSVKENLLDERRYLLDQKAKHLKSLFDIAKNTPINDVDVNKLQKDIESLNKNAKILLEKSKDL